MNAGAGTEYTAQGGCSLPADVSIDPETIRPGGLLQAVRSTHEINNR